MKTAKIHSESNNASLVGVLPIFLYIFDLALLRFGKRYSQKNVVYFHRNVVNVLMYLALYLRNEINTVYTLTTAVAEDSK